MSKILSLNNICKTEHEEDENEAESVPKTIGVEQKSASDNVSEGPSNLSRTESFEHMKEVNAITVVEEGQEEENKLAEPNFCIFQSNILYILFFCGSFLYLLGKLSKTLHPLPAYLFSLTPL